MKKIICKLTVVLAILTAMFCSTSYATSGTCLLDGCDNSTDFAKLFCKEHTCARVTCKNYAEDGGYCSTHRKLYSGSNSSSGKLTRRTCTVPGCGRSFYEISLYCAKHRCRSSNCFNKADKSGYCDKHNDNAEDPYDVYDYDDREDAKSKLTRRTCTVPGCGRSFYEISLYCAKHRCRSSNCFNKADKSGYCYKHHGNAEDPYDVYDYDDPEDFYYDRMDDFDSYEDAEDYWDDAWW